MLSKFLILWIGYFAVNSNAGSVPWIKPCRALDTECMLKSAEYALPYFVKGDEQLGLPAVEPMHVKDTESITGDLKVKFINVTIHQLTQCKIEAFTRDTAKLTASITSNCPIVIKGEYNMTGNLLSIPIFGDGEFSIEGGRMRATTDIKLKTFTKDSKKHYKVGGFDYKFEPISKYFFYFYNLYNGDKERADPIEKVVDGSWKEMIQTFGQGIMKECMTNVANMVGRLFKAVPAEELEIE